MSVLITGGAGYIGSHVCVEFLKAGHDIVLFDNFSNSRFDVVAQIEKITGQKLKVIIGDLLDKKSIRSVFDNFNIGCVVHLAALKSPEESLSQALDYYENNISGTINLLKIMQDKSCKKLIFSSSATVYGENNSVPNHEKQKITEAKNPYGTTKIMIEKIIFDICKSNSNWKIISLRYFNPIGADKSGLIGDSPQKNEKNIMPLIINVAKDINKKFYITGNDFDTPDGTGIRDYIHVSDLAEGHLKAFDYINNITGYEIFNLGTGHGYSVLELIKTFERVNNVKINYEFKAKRFGDLAISYADITKAKKILNWQAKRNLDDMCRDSWRFAVKKIHDKYHITQNNDII